MLVSAAPLWLAHTEGHVLSTGASVGVYAPRLVAAGYDIHHIPFAKHPSFFLHIAKLLRRERFDVVHLHTERADVWYALTVRASLGYRPFVLRTVHHIFKFKGGLRLRKVLERQAMRWILRVTQVSNSPSGQRNERTRYGARNLLAPNWYDSDRFVPPTDDRRSQARAELRLSNDTCVFLSLGGNESYKNYDLIVDALALLPDDLRVLYVQVGSQGAGRPLETAAAELGVAHRVRCAGIVEDPLPYLHAADALLMPSSEEGFGVAAVEAIASGLPVVLADVEALCDFRPYIPDIIWIAPEVSAIASAMATVAAMSAHERRTLGRRGVEAASSHYGLSTGPALYLELYRRRAPNAGTRKLDGLAQ